MKINQAMFNTYLYQPILQSLIFFYHLLGDSFGWAIIGMTFAIRLISAPLTMPAMKVQQKLQKLKPELDKLKKIHPDKKDLQKAQLELYKQHGVNPGAGCLPQIVQIVILIALAALVILGLFLYKNLYVTITQSEEIILLKQEVAPDTIDRTKVNTVLSALEKKVTSADDIDWLQVKNPFNFSVQTPAPSQIGID